MHLILPRTFSARFAFSQCCLPILLALGMVVVVGTPTLATAQSPKKAAKQARQQEDQQKREVLFKMEAEVLRGTYILLASANTNYGGHKDRAMHAIQDALGILNHIDPKEVEQRFQYLREVATASWRSSAGTATDLSQAISDAQVENAGVFLRGLEATLAANKQPKVKKQVAIANKAIAEALQVSGQATFKGREADALAQAYILLVSANHDYDGNRLKAMRHVKNATNILKANLLDNGDVEQKIQAVKDSNAETLAKLKASGEGRVHELQALSDTQLLTADAIIQRVASSAIASGQKQILKHLGDAHGDIGIALSIR